MTRPAGALALSLLAMGCTLERGGLMTKDSGSPDASSVDAGDPPRDASVMDSGRTDAGRRDSGATDAGGRDAARDAGGPLDFSELDWEAPRAIDDSGGLDECPSAGSKDPVLSPDRTWLVLSRFEGDCSTRRFQLYRWNDGAPSFVDGIGPIHPAHNEHNHHLLGGEHAGQPGELLLVYTTNADGGDRDLWTAWLSGDPPLTVATPVRIAGLSTDGSDSDPSLTRTGDRLSFARDGDVYHATGTPPTGYADPSAVDAVNTGDSEVDPALSPDGRVLVFVRTAPEPDLWVARRREPELAFDAPTALPKGGGEINTSGDEWDPFVATNGDLLFVRDGDVYLAPAILPSPGR